MNRGVMKALAASLVVMLILATAWTWQRYGPSDDDSPNDPGTGLEIPLVARTENPFQVPFSDPVYEPTVGFGETWSDADDVQNLANIQEELGLTNEQMSFLIENGVVGIAELPDDLGHEFQNGLPLTRFYDAYDWMFHNGYPIFVTSDMVLDAFHHAFTGVLKDVEEEHLIDLGLNLSRRMVRLCNEQRLDLPSDQQYLAEANVVFFGVPVRLLDPKSQLPSYAVGPIDTIVLKIREAQGMAEVPTFPHPEDFTCYRPRSHYTDTERLGDYFRAMTWYGRMTFRGDDDDLTQRAVLASLALRDDPVANDTYHKLRQPVDFLVGNQDDLTYEEYAAAADSVMGRMPPDYSALFNKRKVHDLQTVLAALKPPVIGIPGEWGLRFMGQSSVLDSYIIQQCIDPEVGGRMLPSGLDVMSALGSDEAWSREDTDGPYGPALNGSLERTRDEVASRDTGEWGRTVYDAWLYSLRALNCNNTGAGHPRFMRSQAWAAKELNTQLASWTQLTHDTLLYRKPTASYMGGGGGGSVYVEPVPELYSRLRVTINRTLEGLMGMGFATPSIESGLERYQSTLHALEVLSICQLEGSEPENPSETYLSLMAYVYLVWSDEWRRYSPPIDNGPTIVVSDVHTLYDEGGPSLTLQEAVGYIKLVVVIAPTTEGPSAFVGAVFQHHEFTRPTLAGRLTDEEWTTMLEDGTAPEPAPWAQDFILG